MPGSTPNRGYPFPIAGEPPAGHLNIQDLAIAVDGDITQIQGSLITTDYVDARTPAGVIMAYGGTNSPAGWLLCNGQAVSRATYPALFAAIGTTHGAGDGSTTFTLPDLRGRTAVMPDGVNVGGVGSRAGEFVHTLTNAEIPSATGDIVLHGAQAGATGVWVVNGVFSNPNPSDKYSGPQTPSTGAPSVGVIRFNNGGGNGAHNNMQPYTALNYIIRT